MEDSMSFAREIGSPFDIHGTAAAKAAIGTTALAKGPYVVPASARRLLIQVFYDANATAGTIVEVVPAFTCDGKMPLVTDDVWTIPSVWDGTVTAGNGVTPVAGVDWTVTPQFGQVTQRQLALRTPASSGVSDKIRIGWTISVEEASFIWLQLIEVGANAGVAWIRGRFYT
jgi:hypothetical protein